MHTKQIKDCKAHYFNGNNKAIESDRSIFNKNA